MYQTLRSQGILSYNVVEQMFEDHQAKWPEAIFNEDSWYKYLAPLEEDGNASYLSMLQGSKASQRKWWLMNRFRYLDSKYNAGDALTNVITLRGYAKANITVTPYADVYAAVRYGSYLVQTRANRGTPVTLVCPLDNLNDTEIYVYSCGQLASIGDLSGLMVGYADFSMAVKLQDLVLGRSNEGLTEGDDGWYSNGNLQTLYLGNNTLLQSIDVRNCTGLGLGEQSTVDISGCSNIRTVLFDGTNITGITLPDGGMIQTLHLPGTITILKILNQNSITDFTCPDTTNITTLWLDNVNDTVSARTIIPGMAAGSRVRLFNFNWEMTNAHELTNFMDLLDTMRGLDQNGNNTQTAQVYGAVHIPIGSTWLANQVESRYSDITLTYDTEYHTVLFRNYDNSLLDYELVDDGEDAVGDLVPTRDPSNTIVYTFDGWATSLGGEVDANALKNVTADRSVYAHYAESTRYYRVRFYNGTTLLDTQYIAYGGYAVYYDSATGSNAPAYTGPGDPEDYSFSGWDQDVSYITQDTDTHAVFVYDPSYVRKYLRNTLTDYTDQNNLTSLGAYAFAGNNALTKLSMPSLTFSNGTVPKLCFAQVTNLSSLTMASEFPAVTKIEQYAFWYFLNGARIRDINDNVVPITLTFPNATEVETLGFSNAGHIHLHLPKVTTVGYQAFYFSYVRTLDLPLITSLGTANDMRYNYLRVVESIIWSSLTTNITPTGRVGTLCASTLKLIDCGMTTRFDAHMRSYTALETVILRNSSVVAFSATTVYSSGIFSSSSPIGQGTGKIYVPSALVSAYKSSSGWSAYSDCFEAIEGSDYEIEEEE